MNLSINDKTEDQKNNNESKEKKEKQNNQNNSSNLSLTLSDISLANPDIKNTQEFEKNQKLCHFILGEKLGQGTFGFVRLAKHSLTGENVAIKILDKEKILKEKDKFRLKNEIKILKKLRHNNIVQLYGVIDTKLSINLIMEYCEGEELLDYINRKQRLKELEACQIFQQIISGIEYLSKNGITHRDLKPENILINKDNLKIKIVDFGLSNIYKKNQLLKSKCGSLCFAAPEMISGKKYNGLNVDIWSSGVILFSMICGYLPFQEEDTTVLYQKIIKGKYQIPYYVSQLAGDLIHKILNINPNKRYTIEQIKKHKWFKMVDMNNIMSEGLLLDKFIVPIDDDIINILVNEYKFNEEEIKISLIKNKHNIITTIYYLLLKKKIKEGKKSICDMNSEEFINYLNNKNNLLENHDNNLDKICKERLNKNYSENVSEINSNSEIITENDLVKEKIEIKIEKLHHEIDDMKNSIITNNRINKTYKNNNYNKNKPKKLNIKNLILNDNMIINKKEKLKKTYKFIKREEIKSNYYSHKRIPTTLQYTKKNLYEEKIPKNSPSMVLHSQNNKNENSIDKEINTISSYKKDKLNKKSLFRLTKVNNNKNINFKLNFNNSKFYSKSKLTNVNKNIIENNLFKNHKSKNYYITTNYVVSERKNNLSLIKRGKGKMTYNPNKNKDSIDLTFSNNKKDKTISSKMLFNSNLINKNKSNINHKDGMDSYNYFSKTIYKDNKFKSIYKRKNKNLSQLTFENNKDEKNHLEKIKQKYNNKKSYGINHRSNNKVNEISVMKQYFNTVEKREKQKKIKIIKNIIKPKIFNTINKEINDNNETQTINFFSSSNINSGNNEVSKKIKKNNLDIPLIKIKNNIKINKH